MEAVSTPKHEKEGAMISSLPDFAEIFLFLQNLGPYMKLSNINLIDLENFFREDLCPVSDEVIHIYWHLLRCAGRHGGKEDWQIMAVKFGRKVGLLQTLPLYQEVSLPVRMKIFRVLCEEQFDCNSRLRCALKRDAPGMLTRPVGVDSEGIRYWLLQDSLFDVRLYGEGNYDQPPPVKPSWTLLSWSLDELANQISLLESHSSSDTAVSSPRPPIFNQSTDTKPPSSHHSQKGKKDIKKKNLAAPPAKRRRGKSSPSPSPSLSSSSDSDEENVGCLKCKKDSDYEQMLLCDECDRECHAYCQYPPLWVIPKGRWVCPICKEELLVKALKGVFLRLSQAKDQKEQKMARKERSVARLQKSGLLLQNIILDDARSNEEGTRSRRNRKQVNYAELNDVYLPPLGRGDVVGGVTLNRPRAKRNTDYYIQEDYLAPRVRSTMRRYRGDVCDLETVKEEEQDRENMERDPLLVKLCVESIVARSSASPVADVNVQQRTRVTRSSSSSDVNVQQRTRVTRSSSSSSDVNVQQRTRVTRSSSSSSDVNVQQRTRVTRSSSSSSDVNVQQRTRVTRSSSQDPNTMQSYMSRSPSRSSDLSNDHSLLRSHDQMGSSSSPSLPSSPVDMLTSPGRALLGKRPHPSCQVNSNGPNDLITAFQSGSFGCNSGRGSEYREEAGGVVGKSQRGQQVYSNPVYCGNSPRVSGPGPPVSWCEGGLHTNMDMDTQSRDASSHMVEKRQSPTLVLTQDKVLDPSMGL